jgi:hypothetical protein
MHAPIFVALHKYLVRIQIRVGRTESPHNASISGGQTLVEALHAGYIAT